jgi:hypothetical protein
LVGVSSTGVAQSALGFNALFFYGRALTVHERTLMIAYSKKEYESIDPVELPAQVSSAEKTFRMNELNLMNEAL